MPFKNISITSPSKGAQSKQKQNQFYVGYSTINADTIANTRIYDFDLIKQDILNQFMTKKGERVMNPTYGTIIWELIFEPFTSEVKQLIADDINRICTSDPRVVPIQIDIDEQQQGVLLEVTFQAIGTDQTANMRLTFDRDAGIISR